MSGDPLTGIIQVLTQWAAVEGLRAKPRCGERGSPGRHADDGRLDWRVCEWEEVEARSVQPQARRLPLIFNHVYFRPGS